MLMSGTRAPTLPDPAAAALNCAGSPSSQAPASMWAAFLSSRRFVALQLRLAPPGVLWVTLARVDAFNALSMELLEELHAVFDALQHPPTMLEALPPDFPRVVVLAAAGRAFCGGVDIKVRCQRLGRALARNAQPEPGNHPARQVKAGQMPCAATCKCPTHISRPRTRASAAVPGTTRTCGRSSC